MGSRSVKEMEDMMDEEIKGSPESRAHSSLKPMVSKTWKVDWDIKIANLFKKIFRKK